MADGTGIEWADATWNPTAGCNVVSPGCANCYAMRTAARLERMGMPLYQGLTRQTKSSAVWAGHVAVADESVLTQPLRWKKPRHIFVNSMSDLFHSGFSFDEIARIFGVMACAQHHLFLVLTKRPEHMSSLLQNPRFRNVTWEFAADYAHAVRDGVAYYSAAESHWPLPNVWLGVSVEDQARADERIRLLQGIDAAVRFLSCEPLLAPVRPDLRGIGWVICGGESGPGARHMDAAWARRLRDQCATAGVAFFMKQMTRRAPIPDDLQLRQFPLGSGVA